MLETKASSYKSSDDLDGYEIKSALKGNAFEYQYHLKSGLKKLEREKRISHVYCTYTTCYSNVSVFLIDGETIYKDFLTKWEIEYLKNYDEQAPKAKRRQRFRRSITHKYVVSNSKLILKIVDGKIVN